MNNILIVFLIISASVLSGCSGLDTGKAAGENPARLQELSLYTGIYELHPSENVRYVVIQENGVFFFQTMDGREILRGFAETDSDALRFITLNTAGRRELHGMFLRNDYNRDTWVGYWDGNVRYLQKRK